LSEYGRAYRSLFKPSISRHQWSDLFLFLFLPRVLRNIASSVPSDPPCFPENGIKVLNPRRKTFRSIVFEGVLL